jgi:hypothetical protein
LRGEYGQWGGNAEEIIASQKAAMSAELRAANKIQPDKEKTEALLAADGLEQAADLIDGPALALAVRGKYVVVVTESDKGRHFKVVRMLSEFTTGEAREEDPAEAEKLAAERERLEDGADLARAQREAENKLEEVRSKSAQRKTAQGRRRTTSK